MTETKDVVMEMVEKELKRKPDTSTTELFELAKAMDPSINEMSVRQFHARYPLQLKRQKSLSEGGGRRRPSSSKRKRATSGASRGRSRRGATESSAPEASTSGASTGGTHTRSTAAGIQSVLIAFARDVAKAHDGGPGAVLDVVADLDRWVEKIEKAR
ncbi:MAG: hypothetical protein RQ745_06590 [Longimicrobiales bacterium]|nr:hypothetical protein [Longimicrobiales bacterium]